MKKITSIFSLALFSVLTLSLSSCNDCEGGEGSWNPGAQGITIDQLEQKLADAANKLVALSSGDLKLITYNEKTGKWYYSNSEGGYDPIELPMPPVTDSKSGSSDDKGIYINYDDGKGGVQTLYIPQFEDNGDGTTTITVGGVTYTIPKACECSITNNGDGSYTITAGGKSEKITIPVVKDWINSVEVKYADGSFKLIDKSGSGTEVVVPSGVATVKINDDGTAVVRNSDGKADSIKLRETQPVVEVVGTKKDSVKVTNYDVNGNKIAGQEYYMPTAGAFAAWTDTVKAIKLELDSLETKIIGDWKGNKTIADSIAGIDTRITNLENKVNSMFKDVFNAIAKSITNIQVEEVMSNAIGSFNGVLTNLKTTKLVCYYGTTNAIDFPSFEDDANQFHKEADEPAMTKTMGEIQLTVNPIGTDFSGVEVSLVNSLGKPSSIKLSNLESSDKLLMTGLTRADDYSGTGLYKTTATIDGNSVNDARLHIAVDKSAVKDAVKSAWHDLKEVYNQRRLGAIQGETVNKVANAIYNVVSGISTERLAIKTEWEDSVKDVTGNWIKTTKSIVSPYDLSGVAVEPLGFESLPEQYRDSLRAFKKAKKAIKKLNTRIAKKIINTINKEADLNNIKTQIDSLQIKIKKVKRIPEDMKIIKQVVNIDTTVLVKVPIDKDVPISINKDIALDIPVSVSYSYNLPTNFRIVDDPDNPGQKKIIYDTTSQTGTASGEVEDTIHFIYTDNVNIKADIETNVRFWIQKEFSFDMSEMVNNVNNALDVVQSVDGLCTSVQKIINNIYKYENKLLAGNYLNGIYKFIDKASAYSAQGIYKLFQPVLLVNSDKGFGFAGIRGVPATVSGTVEVIPTTYSNGLVAPVYKKYIRVKDKDGNVIAPGKVLDEGQVSYDITDQVQNPGSYRIEYYAIDFYGNEIGEEYVIIKE